MNIAKSDGDDLAGGVVVRGEVVRKTPLEQRPKSVYVEGAIGVKDDGEFVPTTKVGRKDAGTNKVIEKMGLP